MKFPPIYFYHPNPPRDVASVLTASVERELKALQLDVASFFVENDYKLSRIKAIQNEIDGNPNIKVYRKINDNLVNPLIHSCAAQIFDQFNVVRKNYDPAITPLADLESYLDMRRISQKNLAFVGIGDDPKLAAFDAHVRASISGSTLGKGMKNIGNSCYIAASIQAILASKLLKTKVMGEIVQKAVEKEEEFAERQKIHKALQALVKALLASQSVETLIGDLREVIFANQYLNAELRGVGKDSIYKQQDAAALMLVLLSVIDHPFESEIRWWVEGRPKPPPIVKPRFLLELEVKKDKNLQQLVEDHFAIHSITDPENKRRLVVNNCDYGEFDTYATEEKIKGSDVCVIQLKRFGNDLKKITAPVSISELIDFSKAFDDGKVHLFKLVSSVRHSGSLEKGHYIAHIHSPKGWLEYNDEAVTRCSQMSSETAHQNYLLFFERHALD